MKIYKKIGRTIGNTRLESLHHISVPNNNNIYCKYEFENPSGSHYDRVYHQLYYYYEILEKKIKPGITPIIENTSGCAGISCSYLGSMLDYQVTIIAPGTIPDKRKENILRYADKLLLTEDQDYVRGTRKLLIKTIKENHTHNDLGVNRKIIAVDPEEAPVASKIKYKRNYNFRLHELYGIGALGINFPFLKSEYYDDVNIVSTYEWEHSLRLLIEKENLFVGHTSAASLATALKIANTVKNKTFLIILYDSLENY